MSTKLAKLDPSRLSRSDLVSMKIQRIGKNWTKFCDDNFEGGYAAVHAHLSKTSPKAKTQPSVTPTVPSFLKEEVKQITNYVPNPVDRALFVMSKVIYKLDWKSRGFLCDIIKRGSMELSGPQDKWLSDLEKRYVK